MTAGDIVSFAGSAACVGTILGAGVLALRLFLSNTGGQIDNTDFFQQVRAQREAEEEAAAEERAKLRAAASGDTPGAFEDEMGAELERRFSSQPEPTRPVILPPSNKRRITPED